MIGILVQLAISWLIAWLYEKNDLRVLGFYPTKARIKDFLVFFLITSVCCSSGFFLKMAFSDLRYELNPNVSLGLIAQSLWWNVRSVLFEELIFRGVLFYILIKKIGGTKALVCSSVAFGIYHWFSFGIIGNVSQMVFVFLLTGTMGLLFGYGYLKTLSLYIPVAIHLGWNLTQGLIFSDGPLGAGILIPTVAEGFRTGSYLVFIVVFLFPMLSTLLINTILVKQKRQVDFPFPKGQHATPGFGGAADTL
ncbi:CPBP family intramembrane glutamic endopeptidase [Aridibaculum aurantiacum]|uniref:CPBP family intramembrane glutamic endopeptidase n=1 Tax=Aridibaculum aurantiacum TaxID=2810307 RepID=UPI001A96E324|nr:CPBP family intramembrane glutamic endopeptidase [Aridibaculum aurantiacum]